MQVLGLNYQPSKVQEAPGDRHPIGTEVTHCRQVNAQRFPVKSLNGIVTQNHRIMTWLFGYQPLVAVSIRFRYMRRIQASGSGTYQQLFASSYAANTLGRNTPLHPHRTLLAKVQAFVPDTSLTISIRNFGQPNMCCCPAKSNMFLAGSSSIAAATRDSIQCQWVM